MALSYLEKTSPGLYNWQEAFKKIYISRRQKKNLQWQVFWIKSSKKREGRGLESERCLQFIQAKGNIKTLLLSYNTYLSLRCSTDIPNHLSLPSCEVHMCWSAQAAIKMTSHWVFYYRNLFLTVLQVGKSKIKMPSDSSLVRTHFLVHRWLFPAVCSHGGRDKGSLRNLFHKGASLTHEGSTLMTELPPKSPTSKKHYVGDDVSTHEFWRDAHSQSIAMHYHAWSSEKD